MIAMNTQCFTEFNHTYRKFSIVDFIWYKFKGTHEKQWYNDIQRIDLKWCLFLMFQLSNETPRYVKMTYILCMECTVENCIYKHVVAFDEILMHIERRAHIALNSVRTQGELETALERYACEWIMLQERVSKLSVACLLTNSLMAFLYIFAAYVQIFGWIKMRLFFQYEFIYFIIGQLSTDYLLS